MTAGFGIIGSATALPPRNYPQESLSDGLCEYIFGADWAQNQAVADKVELIKHVFTASGVQHRQISVDSFEYYLNQVRTVGDRMVLYEELSYPLARKALEACLADNADVAPGSITDFIVVSCTGYAAPGLDILLARDLGMSADVRRTVVGHMGCYAAIVGLRNALAALRAYPGALVALTTVELSSLHGTPKFELSTITSSALFGDAAASLLLAATPNGSAPQLVDTYCAADFATADQMTWKITDEGFAMGLSRRIPITLRRNVAATVDCLLRPHGLTSCDVTHWLVHPGGPDILEVIARELKLSDDQMALSWQILREHGNCSSSTVLLILDALLKSGRTKTGEWGVMMAFGPGLTLETCLLRF